MQQFQYLKKLTVFYLKYNALHPEMHPISISLNAQWIHSLRSASNVFCAALSVCACNGEYSKDL